MLDTLRLITKKPEEALVDILNETYQLRAAYDSVSFSPPVALSGTLTQVVATFLTPTTGTADYTGSVTLQYNRLDIDTFLTVADHAQYVTLPGTTYSFLEPILKTYGIVISPDDFIIEHVPLQVSSYLLKTKAQSLRWVGSAYIKPLLVNEPLSALIATTVLDGLYYPTLIPQLSYFIYSAYTPGLNLVIPTVTTALATDVSNTQLAGFALTP